MNANEKDYPNETMKLLFERGSCRDFLDKKIPSEVLMAILEAGTHSPTGGNLQPYSIVKIEGQGTKDKLVEMGFQKFLAESPVLLLFCIDLRRIQRWASLEVAPFTATSSFRHFWISFQDTIICAQNICTAADSMGLGSVYIGGAVDIIKELRDMLQLPKGVLPVVLLCLGYPRTKPVVRKKLGADVIVHEERYQELDDQSLVEAFDKKYSGPRNDRSVEITEERLDRIRQVCVEVHGEDFAKKCLETIKGRGIISSVQRYFGLHYRANLMPKGNEEFLKLMEELGFDWLKKYEPRKG